MGRSPDLPAESPGTKTLTMAAPTQHAGTMSDVQESAYPMCRSLLARPVVGRVAVCTSAGPRVFPVNYNVVGDSIIFRTSPHGMVASHDWRSPIALEVDHVDYAEQRRWAVLAVSPGVALEDAEEMEHVKRTWGRSREPAGPGTVRPTDVDRAHPSQARVSATHEDRSRFGGSPGRWA